MRVGILLRMNQPHILKPLRVIDGHKNDIYASQHLLGWAVNGPIHKKDDTIATCHRIQIDRKNDLESQIEMMHSQDFADNQIDELEFSAEGKKWERKVKSSLKLLSDKHYEIELPFKESVVSFPSNRNQICKHFETQMRRFKRDSNYYRDYVDFMNMMLDNDFMEKYPKLK